MVFVPTQSGLRLGVAYYPEQWPKSLWPDDFKRMADLGFTVVRMAEFAWSIFEPNEDEFSFELFDQAMDLAHAEGLRVVLGTPTATPPAWLTQKYPEVLNVRQDGVPYQHGQRRHYNYNSPVYRRLCQRIVEKLASHYADHPAVIGWQIDNEINCEVNVFYSEADHAAFREWLQRRYQTLDALNQAWGTVFWNQTYSDWSQLYLSRITVSASPNPHQLLDEKRFISASAISFVQMQADILRQFAPHQFITTNGLFGHLDNHQMTDSALDWISYDSYPNFATIWNLDETVPLHDRDWSRRLSIVRDISPTFWVMEQQAGAGGWVNRMAAPSPKPGQMRLWTFQSVAHGANTILYFRWRTAVAGTEIYWHGLNDYGNRTNRRVTEASQVAREFSRFPQSFATSRFVAQVAFLKDYDNEWDGEFDCWVGPLAAHSESAWFATLQARHVPADWKYLRPATNLEDLSRYDLIIYPHAAIMTESTVELLRAYVMQGGQLMIGCRSGYKSQSGQCYMQPLPGVLSELCGIVVEDFTWIGGTQAPGHVTWSGRDDRVPVGGFHEVLQPTSSDVEAIAQYIDGYYSEGIACTRRALGKGAVYYLGTEFNASIAGLLMDTVGVQSPANDRLAIPPEIELAIRKDTQTGDEYWFLLNFSDTMQHVQSVEDAVDLLSGRTLRGTWAIPPYGAAVLQKTT